MALALGLLALLAAPALPALTAEEPSKHILIVNSYHKEFPWTDMQVRAATRTLREAYGEVEFHVEYLDTKRIFSDEYLEALATTFGMKSRGVRLDGVITTDDNALNFVLANRASLTPGVPVIFCGINEPAPLPEEEKPFVAGYVEVLDIRDNIELILRLHPGTRTIAVVVDRTPTGRGQKKEIAAAAREFPGLHFEFLPDRIEQAIQGLVGHIRFDLGHRDAAHERILFELVH
ncbi:MAG: hypothetical protein HQL11_06515 [Candidatus Omnitrophica bacterium]|nr:hypothetical protein [Candidatus Omnitrophota bacterium]